MVGVCGGGGEGAWRGRGVGVWAGRWVGEGVIGLWAEWEGLMWRGGGLCVGGMGVGRGECGWGRWGGWGCRIGWEGGLLEVGVFGGWWRVCDIVVGGGGEYGCCEVEGGVGGGGGGVG